MKVYSKIDQIKLKDKFVTQILPKFQQNLPLKVLQWCNAVPMEICLFILLVTTITTTSIQNAVKILSTAIRSDTDHILAQYARNYIPQIPHPNRIRHTLKLWTPKQISTRYREINFQMIRQMKKGKFFSQVHQKKGVAVAFDLTEKGYYGEKNQFTTYTKGRSPAKLCHSYLTLQIVCPGMRLILDVEPVYQNSKSLDQLMKKMLRRVRRKTGLKISIMYLDRGFYQVNVLRYLKHNFKGTVLMPVIRTSRVKTAIREWYDLHGYKAGTLELVIGPKSHPHKYTLIFAPLSEKERAKWRRNKDADPEAIHNDFLYFCLQEPPKALMDQDYSFEEIFKILSHDYRKRWGIETGYRVYKDIWGKTTSQSYSLRLWLMWNAVMIYNLWVMENQVLIETKLADDYGCCEVVSLEEIEDDDNLRKSRKYPTWSRVTAEMPSRKWKPVPVEPMSALCESLKNITVRIIGDWIKTGYDPPLMKIEKSTSS